MKAKIQVIFPSEMKRNKEGKPMIHEVQCALLDGENLVAVLKIWHREFEMLNIGEEITGEDGVKQKVIQPGAYEIEFGIGVGWDDKEVRGIIKSMVPLGVGNKQLAAINHSVVKKDSPVQ